MAHTASLMVLAFVGLSPAAGDAVGGWERTELVGHTLALVDDRQIRRYYFHEKGHAVATIGRNDGVVYGPVFYWHINQDGVLVISKKEDGRQVRDRIRKVKVLRDRVEVERSGTRETYTRTKD